MKTLKSLRLLIVSLFLISGASVLAQQAPPATPPKPPEEPRTFSFFMENGSFLGVYTEEINRENMSRYGLNREPRGVGITRVIEGSPAERAGLKKDDVIVKFDGEAVTSVRKLNRLISEVAPEHAARLTIIRGGDERELTVTLGKRSDFNSGNSFPGGQRWQDLDRLRDFRMDDRNNSFSFVLGNNRRIGATTTQLTKQLADYFGVAGGLLVTSVREESPAAKAGLRAGDIITEADGNRIETVSDLIRAINRKEDGELALTVTRDKSQRTIRLTPERNRSESFTMPGGAFIAPEAMQIVLPKIDVDLPHIVVPASPQMRMRLPKVNVPQIRINVPARLLSLPATPL